MPKIRVMIRLDPEVYQALENLRWELRLSWQQMGLKALTEFAQSQKN